MISKLRWLTSLSLDAPLVAVSWQALLSHAFASPLQGYHYVIVFLSVWLGYAADRWFDNLRSEAPRSEHHRFIARHARIVFFIWVLILLVALTLSFSFLTSSELTRGFALLALALLYAAFAQKGRKATLYPFIKSVFTSLLVLASSLLFLKNTEQLRFLAIAPVFIVWLLFTGNCLIIRAWTRSSERKSEQCGIFVLVGTAVLSFTAHWSATPEIAAATLASACLLLALNKGSRLVPKDALRTLADLCLLTPLLALPFL